MTENNKKTNPSSESNPASLRDLAGEDAESYPILRRAIAELYLRPGASFSIKELCEMFGMGRSPVRDALIRLEQEGLVSLLPQKGTQVAKISFARIRQERFLRAAVEEEVMKRFMACHTPSDFAALDDSLRRQRDLCGKKIFDARRFLTLDEEFHKLFYVVTENEYCQQVIGSMSGHDYRMRVLCLCGNVNAAEIVEEHASLIAAMQARDTETMLAIFRRHICRVDAEKPRLLRKYPHLFDEPQMGDEGTLRAGDFLGSLLNLGVRGSRPATAL